MPRYLTTWHKKGGLECSHDERRNERTKPVYWRRTGSSRNCHGPFKRAASKGENFAHLLPADGGEPLQKFFRRRAPAEVLEERGYRYARAAEAPSPTELPAVAVDSTAGAPVHVVILTFLD